MNPVILTEVVGEATETAKTFAETMNGNTGVLQFAGLCLAAIGLGVAIWKVSKSKKRR